MITGAKAPERNRRNFLPGLSRTMQDSYFVATAHSLLARSRDQLRAAKRLLGASLIPSLSEGFKIPTSTQAGSVVYQLIVPERGKETGRAIARSLKARDIWEMPLRGWRLFPDVSTELL